MDNDEKELPAEQIGAFHWVKLLLTSATTIKWLLVLVIGGAATNADVQQVLQENLPTWGDTVVEESLPIPAGETTVPVAPTVSPEVRQSLSAMNAAINKHSGQLRALQEELVSLEERREVGSERDDDVLEGRIKNLENYHN